jgi:hypothetical protein
MKEEIQTMTKLYFDFTNKNIPSLTNNLIETNKLIVSLTNSFYNDKVKFENWKQHMEILLLKYSFHSSTLISLLKGTTVTSYENDEIKFTDICSIRIILRSIIENYLIIKHLFFDPKSSDEGEFRFYLYEWSGLISRQKLGLGIPSEEFKNKVENDKTEIERLEKLINENNYFQTLDPKIQKEIIRKKHAKEFSWEKLLENSDITSDFFKPMWKLFSNTAHSELLGAIQFKGFIKSQSDDLENEISLNLFSATLINASLITNLKEKYPNTEKIFNSLTNDLKTKITMWTNLARKKNIS